MASFVSRFRNMRSLREQHAQQRQEFENGENQPSWPPVAQDKKRGRATRIIQTPEPFQTSFSMPSSSTQQNNNNNNNNNRDDDEDESFLPNLQNQQNQQNATNQNEFPPVSSKQTLGYYFQSTLFKTRDEREVEKDEAAKRMEQDQTGSLGRLQNRTQTVDQWVHHTGGKKKPEGQFAPHSDNGGNVIVHDPLVIKGKVRKGHQNDETTELIAKEIELREGKRERDIAVLEKGRNFYSLFSEQPKFSHGTAHVKPIWGNLPNNNNNSGSNTPSRNYYPASNLTDATNSNNNNNNSNTSVLYNLEGHQRNDPLYQKADPAGLQGVGYVDQFRQKQRGKQQYRGVHALNSLTPGEGIHKKAPDGSRGLRINQQASQAVDSVKLAFDSNPTPVRGRNQFSTTSSSIGNPTIAGELKDFVHGSTRDGPNTRHFSSTTASMLNVNHQVNSGNNYTTSQFPPIGASAGQGFSAVHGGGGGGTSSFYRSRTPFPMSSNQMMGDGKRKW